MERAPVPATMNAALQPTRLVGVPPQRPPSHAAAAKRASCRAGARWCAPAAPCCSGSRRAVRAAPLSALPKESAAAGAAADAAPGEAAGGAPAGALPAANVDFIGSATNNYVKHAVKLRTRRVTMYSGAVSHAAH